MTEPSQYFKGRTVQEQMNEVIGYVNVRSAEVATTAIASDVAQVHQDMLDADADAQAAAASAAAAAGTLANAVKKTGEASQSIAGNIAVAGNLSGGVVTGTVITAPTPVNNTDAANKKYVDDADALKADKTYVDAQDALLVPIANINKYAVSLTGNQESIAGNKTFIGAIIVEGGRFAQNTLIKNKIDDVTEANPASERQTAIWFIDKNNSVLASFAFNHLVTGEKQLAVYIHDKNGAAHKTVLATYTDS